MTTSRQEEIGKRIRAARERAGLSQSELSQRSGLQQSLISKWEIGKKAQSVETLSRIAEALGIPLEELTGGPAAKLGEVESGVGRAPLLGSLSYDQEAQSIDAARRLTETLTLAWNNGQFASLKELAETARGIGIAFPAAGRAYVEGWIQLIADHADDANEPRVEGAASPSRGRARSQDTR